MKRSQKYRLWWKSGSGRWQTGFPPARVFPKNPKAAPEPATRPMVLTCRHWVEPVMPDNVRLPLTRKVESKVDEAFTKIPAVVEVGVRALANRVSHAPGVPEDPQAAPEPATRPMVLTCRHCAEPVIEPKVRLSRTLISPVLTELEAMTVVEALLPTVRISNLPSCAER